MYVYVCDDNVDASGSNNADILVMTSGGDLGWGPPRAPSPWQQSNPGMRDKEADGTIAQGQKRQGVSFEPGLSFPARYCSIHL